MFHVTSEGCDLETTPETTYFGYPEETVGRMSVCLSTIDYKRTIDRHPRYYNTQTNGISDIVLASNLLGLL